MAKPFSPSPLSLALRPSLPLCPPRLPPSVRCSSGDRSSPKPPPPTPPPPSPPAGANGGSTRPAVLSMLLSVADWADEIKERGMRNRRPLYDASTWRSHRSARRHLRHVLSSLSSRVVVSLIPSVSFFTAVVALVATYNSAVSAHWLPW